MAATAHPAPPPTPTSAPPATAPNGQIYDAEDGKGSVTRYRHPVSNKAGWNPNLPGWDPNLGDWANSDWITVGNPKRLRRVDGDNKATNGTYLTCLTCHFAHGSSAAATGWASGVAPTNGSALLFLDNRGVCQNCHDKSDSNY